MKLMNDRMDWDAVTIDQSAALLGIDEFSVLSRIQSGDINGARARSGEIVIPTSELERLIGSPVAKVSVQDTENRWPDERLDIQRQFDGLKKNGERHSYKVAGLDGRFTDQEMNSYRAAFNTIANELESFKNLKKQLNGANPAPTFGAAKITTADSGPWEARSALLNLRHGEILLCRRGDEFAVIERFNQNSPYAKANGSAQILSRGNDANLLTEDFKTQANLTLEFGVSNLAAKAQKVVWEQFPDDRPARIVAAISEKCRQAVTNSQAIYQDRIYANTRIRGMRI